MRHHWFHNVIRTPIDTINIVGAGGIDQGTICECAGPPGSGKSAFAYGTASNFLIDNPDGVVVILDPELSADLIRLEHTFQLDMTRVLIRNARTLESGFAEFNRVIADLETQVTAEETVTAFLANWDLKKAVKAMKEAGLEPDLELLDPNVSPPEIITKAQAALATLLAFRGKLKPERTTPVLVIWDTIAASMPKAELEAAQEGKDPMNAGGMGLRARTLTPNLMIMMTALYNKPVTVLLLNQIRMTGFGTWKGPEETSSGGHALKHTNHYYFWFEWAKKIYDEDRKMNIGSTSKVSILKSKFGPTIEDIPVYINDMIGGKIIPDDEAILVARDLGILRPTGGWWKFRNEDHGYRWDKEIIGNPEIRNRCLDLIARHFRMNYFTLDIVYKKIGLTLGDLSEADLQERQDLLNTRARRQESTRSTEQPPVKESVKESKSNGTKKTRKKEKEITLDEDDGENPFAPPPLKEKTEEEKEIENIWATLNEESKPDEDDNSLP